MSVIKYTYMSPTFVGSKVPGEKMPTVYSPQDTLPEWIKENSLNPNDGYNILSDNGKPYSVRTQIEIKPINNKISDSFVSYNRILEARVEGVHCLPGKLEKRLKELDYEHITESGPVQNHLGLSRAPSRQAALI